MSNYHLKDELDRWRDAMLLAVGIDPTRQPDDGPRGEPITDAQIAPPRAIEVLKEDDSQ